MNLGISTFAAIAATFVVNAAISPSAMATGEYQSGGIISSRPPRLPTITPIGTGGKSFGRFMLALTTGDCMKPILDDRQYLLIDKRLSVRSGDLVTMKLKDGPMAGSVITKRFVEAFRGIGGEPAIAVAQTYPHHRIDVGLEEIEWAYRVRGTSRSLIGTIGLMVMAAARPRSMNERLGVEG